MAWMALWTSPLNTDFQGKERFEMKQKGAIRDFHGIFWGSIRDFTFTRPQMRPDSGVPTDARH